MPVASIIAAIFLPPLGIFLEEGVSRNFWIGFALTCLAFAPGMIFALYVILARHRSGAPVPA